MNDFAGSADQIAKQLVAGGMEPDRAMMMALRMAQSRQQADESILGGVPTQPPTSDVPPATEILGGDPSRLFQRQPTTMERVRDLPKDVLGAGEALVSMGSLAALAPASMLYALRPGQKTQGDPMEFALRNMYMPRSERGPSHLAGLGEVLGAVPQTGPLPELQAVTGVGRGVGRQLAEKGRQAGRAMAPTAANVAEDILSRQGLLMQVAPSGPTRVEAPASPLGFYDPVHQAALNIQRKQGPGQAFLNELQRSENVNKEFLESSGLAEKLRTTPNITREEVQSLAKGAVPEIQEVVKGSKEIEATKRAEANLNQSWRTLENSLPDMPMLKFYNLRDMWADAAVRGDQAALENIKALNLPKDIEDAVFAYGKAKIEYADTKQLSRENPVKYAQYQLPGGENYREVLLKMPSFRPSIKGMTRAEYNAAIEKADKEGIKNYTSPHWEEPNVVFHIRMNDRTDADGKKVLFIEEIQSDWAQEGRKKGFQTNDLKIDGKTAEEWQNEAVRLFESMPDVPSPEQTSAMNAASRNARELRDRARSQGLKDGQQVPVAPFVTNTKEWVDLSLKNIIKRAVDEGYDRVAFINGTQSADRYDLSKQVESISYQDRGDGTYRIIAAAKDRGVAIPEQTVSKDKLADVVGQEVAKKIVSGEGKEFPAGSVSEGMKSLSGLDLQVGGEGMKAFYDKLVPERINAILKRFGGGKTTPVQFQVAPASSLYPDKTSLRETITQPGFDITPAMRERFQKPIPYKQGGSVNHKAVASARRALEKAMGGKVKKQFAKA